MTSENVAFIGLDTSKLKISVAVADGERNDEVLFLGDISSEPASVEAMVKKLAKRGARLHFCYEAGPTGYGLYRQIVELGHECNVVAPSLVPKRAGDRVKTNRRDAISLARLHRAGELISVWVPDEAHEAFRDLVRARSGLRGTKAGAATTAIVLTPSRPILYRTQSVEPRGWTVAGILGVRSSSASDSAGRILVGFHAELSRFWSEPLGLDQRGASN